VKGFKDENILSGISYSAKPGDLFIVTYPKNGTTWMQQIVTLIQNNGNIPDLMKENGTSAISPFLEKYGKQAVYDIPSDTKHSIKTHMPYRLTPKHPEAKYIVVIRNPKDACVSQFHHYQLHEQLGWRQRNFHDFFPIWLAGDVGGADYFDWYLEWFKHKDDDNVLFVVYENMKKDIESSIFQVASFMGQEYRDSLQNKEILQQIVEKSSFSFMKKNHKFRPKSKDELEKSVEKQKEDEKYSFIRKGIIGDWMSHLTDKENDALEKRTLEKFSGTGLLSLWKEFGIFSFDK